MTTRLEGRDALAAHLASLDGLVSFDGMVLRTVHQTSDPTVVILEFDGFGTGDTTGRPYEQSYISVITLKNGRIAHYRDYWNPLIVIEAMGVDALQTSFAKGQVDA